MLLLSMQHLQTVETTETDATQLALCLSLFQKNQLKFELSISLGLVAVLRKFLEQELY